MESIKIEKAKTSTTTEPRKKSRACAAADVVDDYIQFTKNKNEFVFKCNDKELLPEIMLEFLSLWKSRIILLNSMQNQYLTELRDALLPFLMSGKINLT